MNQTPIHQALKGSKEKKKVRGGRREQHYIVRDMFLAISLCHNVTPVYPNADDPEEKDFQASSPDEIALVKFAEEMGIKLERRDEVYI